jgi:hypothetical protein
MTDKPDKTLLALARRLEKLASAPADQRFIQLGTYSPDFTAAIAEARQDAVLQWVDSLMTDGPATRRARSDAARAYRGGPVRDRAHEARPDDRVRRAARRRASVRPTTARGRPAAPGWLATGSERDRSLTPGAA